MLVDLLCCRTYQALKAVGEPSTSGSGMDVNMLAEEGEEGEDTMHTGPEAMDTDAGEEDLALKGKEGLARVKELALQVLKDNDFEDKRSSKLHQDDFLRLLAVFNEKDIHFA